MLQLPLVLFLFVLFVAERHVKIWFVCKNGIGLSHLITILKALHQSTFSTYACVSNSYTEQYGNKLPKTVQSGAHKYFQSPQYLIITILGGSSVMVRFI